MATRTLIQQLPPNAALVTASAAAWKTEDLGFEVSGRVEFVVDQNAEIEGRTFDASGKLIIAGTPIARIESERYELAVATAKAAVARAEQDLAVAQTDLDETIPAQIDAANASVELARVEYDRSKRLRAQNAGSQSDVDSARASFQNAAAELKQLIASEKSQKAQIESYTSAVLQAQQDLRDAERDLEDCTLYSSFRGKVAETSVVPGSMVSAGAPVVTLQMMDPIKVELEVSGEQSRKLQRTQALPVYVTMPDGRIQVTEGFLHQIDPSADELTRTFTLTILVLNKPLAKKTPSNLATTRDVWRVDLPFIPGAKPGDLYVEESSILT
ncbi:MAG: HlyD family efflux transporter periplasmic adaptor subunit, partial [Planctomycetota bacterium]